MPILRREARPARLRGNAEQRLMPTDDPRNSGLLLVQSRLRRALLALLP